MDIGVHRQMIVRVGHAAIERYLKLRSMTRAVPLQKRPFFRKLKTRPAATVGHSSFSLICEPGGEGMVGKARMLGERDVTRLARGAVQQRYAYVMVEAKDV